MFVAVCLTHLLLSLPVANAYMVFFYYLYPISKDAPFKAGREPMQPALDVVQSRLQAMYPFLRGDTTFRMISQAYGNESVTCNDDLGWILANFFKAYYANPDYYPSHYETMFATVVINSKIDLP